MSSPSGRLVSKTRYQRVLAAATGSFTGWSYATFSRRSPAARKWRCQRAGDVSAPASDGWRMLYTMVPPSCQTAARILQGQHVQVATVQRCHTPFEFSALHLQKEGAFEASVAMDQSLAICCVCHHRAEVLAARVADQQALVPVLRGITDEGPVDPPFPQHLGTAHGTHRLYDRRSIGVGLFDSSSNSVSVICSAL